MNLRTGSCTDIGKLRDRNEDAVLVKDRLFVIADGMGGHRGGDVASSMAVDALADLNLPDQSPMARLVEEIRNVNRAVLKRGSAEQALRGMGTTLTAIFIEDGTAYLAHVGDSRAYLLRDGALQQLTEDHTLVQRMVREGKITAEQADHHPQRNILTRAVGVDDELRPEELTMDIHPGDRFVLCSDGLTGMVEEDEIQDILESEAEPQAACERLVEAANRAGGDDNISVIVVDVTNGEDAPDPEAVAERPEPPAPPKARSIRRRVVTWLVALVVVLAVAFVGLRIYLSHQWYVGDSNGRVAIFHGIPANVLGYHLSHVAVGTDISASSAEQLDYWRDLGDGITAESLQDARDIVNRIRTDVGQSGASTP
jgi:protein phosphatase